jgi:MinD-like ATPase involved in chromosome partitioning or flagellar assembly
MVPQDPMLEQAVRYRKVVSVLDKKSRSSRAYAAIAESLADEKRFTKQEKWGISQMFSSILTRK